MGAYRKPERPVERAPKRGVVVTRPEPPADDAKRAKREAAILMTREMGRSAHDDRVFWSRVAIAITAVGALIRLCFFH